MPRDRQKRSADPRVYLISRVDENERILLGKRIQRLGAVYAKTEHFQNNATHVICGKLSRSEKFLGALVLGRWVVRPEYVTASWNAGKWLNEVDYEWSILERGSDRLLAAAAKRNRWRASMTTESIFSGWQAAVVLSDAKKQNVYKRLLTFGKAKIVDLKLPAKNADKDCEHLTYLFLDKKTALLAQSLQERGVMCLNCDFISDYIVCDPHPDPVDYVLQTIGGNSGASSSFVSDRNETALQISDLAMQVGTCKEKDNNVEMLQTETLFNDEMLTFSQFSPVKKNGLANAITDDVIMCGTKPVVKLERLETHCVAATIAYDQTPFPADSQPGSVDQSMEDVIVVCDGPSLCRSNTSVVEGVIVITDDSEAEDERSVRNVSKQKKQSKMKITDDSEAKEKCSVWNPPQKQQEPVTTSNKYASVKVKTKERRRKSKIHVSKTRDRSPLSKSVGSALETVELLASHKCAGQQKCKSAYSTSALRMGASMERQGGGLDCGDSERGQPCPVVITPLSSPPTLTTKSWTVSTSAPSTANSSWRKRQASDSPITMSDPTNEIKKLKKDMSKLQKQQLLPCQRSQQKTLRDWFVPVGKENLQKTESMTGNVEITKFSSGKKLLSMAESVSGKTRVEKVSDRRENSKDSLVKASGCASNIGSDSELIKSLSNCFRPSQSQSLPDANSLKSLTGSSVDLGKTLANAEVSSLPSLVSDCRNHNSNSEMSSLNTGIIEAAAHPDNRVQDSLTVCLVSEDPLFANLAEEDLFRMQTPPSSCFGEAHTHSISMEDGSASVKMNNSAWVDVKKSSQNLTSQDVLSSRSLNKTRCSNRKKKSSSGLPSFPTVSHKRNERIPMEETCPLTTTPEKVRQDNVSQERRKTVRGLASRQITDFSESVDAQLNESAKCMIEELHVMQSVPSSSSIPDHERKIKCKTTDESSEILVKPCVLETDSDIVPFSCSKQGPSNVTQQSAVVGLSLENDNSHPHWIFNSRWRLSGVPLPDQFDLTQSNAASLEELGCRMDVPVSVSYMMSSCLDEEDFQLAVETGLAMNNSCPSVKMFTDMMQVLMKADSHMTVNQANVVLMSWVDQFPPVTSTLLSMYEEALGLDNWETVRNVLQNAVEAEQTRQEAGPGAHQGTAGAVLMLRLVTSVLERNFLYFAHSGSRQTRRTCLMIKCLWSSFEVYPNARTRDLLQFLERSLRQPDSPQACWQDLLRLASMAVQCCHLVDNGWQWKPAGLVERCSGAMVQELVYSLTGVAMSSVTRLQQLMGNLSPPWLLRQVAATLLGNYDDYLVPGGMTPGPITLESIVSKYFFLLPNLSGLNRRENSSPRKKCKESCVEKDENKAPPVDTKLSADRINKQNPKGETMLHRAAMRNDVSALRKMLSVPRVDVNIQDHAGWTVLHEACNHGHVECVKALLQFRPVATLDSFFHAGSKHPRRVDIRLTNTDGITVLHDAVNTNHINIVKLLLKYGADSLLNSKTVFGETPLDLASTEEMRQVLTRDVQELGFSQGSFSQDMDSQMREAVPTSFMYSEVLNSSGSTQLSASLEDMQKCLALLTMLLRSHLQILNEERQLLQQEQQQKEQAEQASCVQGEEHQDCEELREDEAKNHMNALRRHVKKVTVKDVYSGLAVPLCVLEMLLTECCRV